MSKQIDEANKIDLNYAYQSLGLTVKSFAKLTDEASYDKAVVALQMAQMALDRVAKSLGINTLIKENLPPATPLKKPGMQPPGDPNQRVFPEPPKDGSATGHIPESILKGPTRGEILSHVMERIDRAN